MIKTCKTCAYFVTTKQLNEFNVRRPKGEQTNGECRRYAPKPFQTDGDNDAWTGRGWVWPIVASGWECGEWAAK